jgi:hypothetical protein
MEEAGIMCKIVMEGVDLGVGGGGAGAEFDGGRDFFKRVLHCMKMMDM